MELPPLLSVNAACEALGVGRTKLYALIGAGALAAHKIGSKTVVSGQSIAAFITTLPPAPIGCRTRERG